MLAIARYQYPIFRKDLHYKIGMNFFTISFILYFNITTLL